MMFDNFLPKAFFISLAVHTVFLCSSLFHPLLPPHKSRSQGVEISYKPQPEQKKVDVRERPIKPSQRLDLKSTPLSSSEGTIPLKLAKEQRETLNNFMAYERKPEQIRSVPMAHRVSITPIRSDKINNPAYAAYNEMVRSRIEVKVYENYRKMEAGSVYLTFIIASDGSLKAAQVINEKTSATDNLKYISLKSLRDSQFPPFLKGMTLPEYSFNIEVQYKVQDE